MSWDTGCLKVSGRRIHRRRRPGKVISITLLTLRINAIKGFQSFFFLRTFRFWLESHRDHVRVKPVFELSPYESYNGRLYWVRLEFESDNTIPRWYPSYDLVDPQYRNYLHMSVCFDKDVKNMPEQEQAQQYINELLEDPNWNGNTIYDTFVLHFNSNTLTFNLAGFQGDKRMRWLHEHGHYYDRSFGHIATYVGGLYRT